MLIDQSPRKDLPLRTIIPFDDCDEANRPALANIMFELGLNVLMLELGLDVHPSGVRWAEYGAIPTKTREKSLARLEVPRRTGYAENTVTVSLSQEMHSEDDRDTRPYEGELSEVALSQFVDFLFCDLSPAEGVVASAERW